MLNAQLQQAIPFTLIVGLGETGMSVIRYLHSLGESMIVVDSREEPPGLDHLKNKYPEIPVELGNFDQNFFNQASRIVLSPGVSPHLEVVQQAIQNGVDVIGDIELFAHLIDAPVIVITGSNGKSTVTALVGEMAKAADLRVAVGGNIGVPALDLLAINNVDLYVLELSSFQLEMTYSLSCLAAVVLNISDDHLDRHSSLQNYAAIKQKVYQNCKAGVINQDDPVVAAMVQDNNDVIRYGLKQDSKLDIKLSPDNKSIIFYGEYLIDCDQIKMPGRHNVSNAMAAAALANKAGIPIAAIVQTLKNYAGLPHRCQWVAQNNGVDWYDDSKGTNVGATIAAIEGLPQKKLVLIAGGQGKGADFSELARVIITRAQAVVLIGEDADKIESAIAGRVDVYRSSSMKDAVNLAHQLANPGDAVLLSPACASFDMFKGYADRGMQFQQAVHEVNA